MVKVREEAAKLGRVSSPFNVTGKSGVRHTFTFGTSTDSKVDVVCDVVLGTASFDETIVLSLFIKAYDIGNKHTILCASPSLSEDARKLSGLYKILVVEAPSKDDTVSKLSDLLSDLAKA